MSLKFFGGSAGARIQLFGFSDRHITVYVVTYYATIATPKNMLYYDLSYPGVM